MRSPVCSIVVNDCGHSVVWADGYETGVHLLATELTSKYSQIA
ncbi:MAG: hypothetical protein ABJP48_05880 [Erythrobacter sp.]